MKRIILGRSGLDVPVFALGSAPLAHVTPCMAHAVLQRGVELGATWWDTSEDYSNYSLLARAMADYPRELLTISTKSNALNLFDGHASVNQALREFQTDYLDIVFLHCVQDDFDLVRRRGCLEALLGAKEKGKIRAIGFSSHYARMIDAAAQMAEIDVVMAPWNIYGRLPGKDAPVEMEHAIHHAFTKGKGVVLMKLLAYGELSSILDEAIHAGVRFAQKQALCIGISSVDELEADIRLSNGETVDRALLEHLKSRHRWDEAA